MKRWVMMAICAMVILGTVVPVSAQDRRGRNWRDGNRWQRQRDRDRDLNGSFWTGAVVGGVVGGIVGHEIGDDDRYDRRYPQRTYYRDRYDDRYYDRGYSRDRYVDRYPPVYQTRAYVTREYYVCRTHRDPCRCVPPPRCETRFYQAPRCD